MPFSIFQILPVRESETQMLPFLSDVMSFNPAAPSIAIFERIFPLRVSMTTTSFISAT
jgi:hypothetical protein